MKDCHHKLEKLQKLVPEARIGIARGQMAERFGIDYAQFQSEEINIYYFYHH